MLFYNGDYKLVIKAEKGATFCGFLDVGSIGISKPEQWFDLRTWINEGCREFQEEDNSDLGNVYIIKLPKDKLKVLAETKRIFFLNISTGLIYKKVNNKPYEIMEEIYISKVNSMNALNGDTVIVKIIEEKEDGKSLEGKILKIKKIN